MLQVTQYQNLKSYHTFGLNHSARRLVRFDRWEEMLEWMNCRHEPDSRILIMGGGSNLLFRHDFAGTVLLPVHNQTEIINEDANYVWVKADAGLQWDRLVAWAVKHGYGGIENLSDIPGHVGAAPVQNIGAYGVEVSDVIERVHVIDMKTGRELNLPATACHFGYRKSLFKSPGFTDYLVWSVVFKLTKIPNLKLDYRDLAIELKGYPDPGLDTVREAVIRIRQRKLPDLSVAGNAGSFFKNPEISAQRFRELNKLFPGIPSFPLSDGKYKIPAAWLIEQCGWKGFREGDAGVHPGQPLVLVNYGRASGEQIMNLAKKIERSVNIQFGIQLEKEVRVI
ncbi:MAG: UDP-N-acetylmuramate dehydrogenase [Bacteroidales bacterium]|nr:UDP-N-acetylmuramate dehydrogenase [Bacteroidales bacterium]